MTKWWRVEIKTPIFHRRRRGDPHVALIINGERMWVRRYISPTSAWVERTGIEKQ